MPTPREDESATEPSAKTADGTEPPRVRATSTSGHRVVGSAPSETVVVTAEIPVVRVPQSRPGEVPTWSRYSPYAPPGPRDDGPPPAPAGLRFAVWVLVFVLILLIVGLAVELVHPDWLSSLRNTSNTIAPSALTTPTSAPKPATTHLASKGLVHTIPAGTYSIVITTAEPCWTVIKTPPNKEPPYFIATILPADSPKTFSMTGPSSVDLSAQITSLAIKSGGNVVVNIKNPKLESVYVFEPGSSNSQ